MVLLCAICTRVIHIMLKKCGGNIEVYNIEKKLFLKFYIVFIVEYFLKILFKKIFLKFYVTFFHWQKYLLRYWSNSLNFIIFLFIFIYIFDCTFWVMYIFISDVKHFLIKCIIYNASWFRIVSNNLAVANIWHLRVKD